MIKYDEYELLELFENNPVMLYEEDVGIYEYAKNDINEFTLKMYINIYERVCIFTLLYKNLKYPLYDIDLRNVETIKCKDDKLIIQQTNNKKNVIIYFKPNYTLKFEDRLD